MSSYIKRILKWLDQYLCNHHWEEKHWDEGHYDEEAWFECKHCGKQHTKD